MKRLAVLGAGGHGRVVADTAELCGWSVAFFDAAWPGLQNSGCWKVAGNDAEFGRQMPGFDGVIVAVGDNSVRLARLRDLQKIGAPLVSIVHPAAVVSRHARLGLGSVVFAGAVINVDARIGSGAILNTGCTVDHDCVLGDGVHVSPGACLAGGVTIGELSWIGIGASVLQTVRVGSRATIGAGAVVVADVPDGVKVAGVPAKTIK